MQAYGSGHFGHWITDEAGLPAYEYTCNHVRDPAAEYATPHGVSRDHFHLLGNLNTSAIAHNEGYVELFRPGPAASWVNRYAPERRAYAGGFGFVRLDRGIRSTLYRHLAGPFYRRFWGMGYFRKSAVWGDLAIDQVTVMPHGNDPVLLSLTTLSNRGLRPLTLSYVEYWDVLVTRAGHGPGQAWRIAPGTGVRRRTRYDRARRLLLCSPAGDHGRSRGLAGRQRPDPPTVFLAAIDGLPVAGFESSRDLFFGEGALDAPAALQMPFLAGNTFSDPVAGDRVILAMQRNVAVPPGGRAALAHMYGFGAWDSGRRDATGSDTPAGLVERYAMRPARAWFEESLRKWREALVRFEAPEDGWLAREAAWGSYYAQALALLDGYTGETFLDRGGCRTYGRDARPSPSDSCRQALALLPTNPAEVRGTIRHLTRLCCPDGSMPRARPPGSLAGLRGHEPPDLHLWLLWLIADYVLFYRDRAFADQEVPLYPQSRRQTTTIRQQMRRSLDYLRRAAGHGRPGLLHLDAGRRPGPASLAQGLIGRWLHPRQGESILHSGLAGVVLPRVAQLCRWLGETGWAQEVEEWAAESRRALAGTWNGHWFDGVPAANGHGGGHQELRLDRQPWVLLAGAASEAQQFILTRNILDYLSEGWDGGPRLPSDALHREVPFALCGPLVWALAQQDPDAAWSLLRSCTLAGHAEASPEQWFGIWSGPDSLAPAANGHPAGAEAVREALSLGDRIAPYSDFPIGDGLSANHLLFALARLAGIEPDAQGYLVRPRLPFRRFRFDTTRLGLNWQEDCVEGHIVAQGNDAVQIRVIYPEPFAGPPRVSVNRRSVPCRLSEDGREVSFGAFVRGGLRTEWEVRPGPEAPD